jgi:heme/copper-type cytochrome/quinol oxidase subunit 2
VKPKQQVKAAGKRRHPAKEAQLTAEASSPRRSTHLGAVWPAVPIGIISLIVIVPIILWIVSWRRNRKARLEYERWHGRTKDAA